MLDIVILALGFRIFIILNLRFLIYDSTYNRINIRSGKKF